MGVCFGDKDTARMEKFYSDNSSIKWRIARAQIQFFALEAEIHPGVIVRAQADTAHKEPYDYKIEGDDEALRLLAKRLIENYTSKPEEE